MKGNIDILVACQYFNGNFVKLYRSIQYEYTPGDLTAPTEESRIYWFLKDNLSKINVAIEDDVLESIIYHIDLIYTNLPEFLAFLQKRAPLLLMKFYEKIESFSSQIEKLMALYSGIELLHKLTETKQILNHAKREIMSFWKQTPETFLRLPLRIIENDLDVFTSQLYLPYVLSCELLPTWTDPIIVSAINESRKKFQTKEQRANYFVLFRLMNGLDCWTIKHIINYIPLSFDLMVSQTPWEFSLGKSRTKDDISIYVS